MDVHTWVCGFSCASRYIGHCLSLSLGRYKNQGYVCIPDFLLVLTSDRQGLLDCIVNRGMSLRVRHGVMGKIVCENGPLLYALHRFLMIALVLSYYVVYRRSNICCHRPLAI